MISSLLFSKKSLILCINICLVYTNNRGFFSSSRLPSERLLFNHGYSLSIFQFKIKQLIILNKNSILIQIKRFLKYQANKICTSVLIILAV